MSASRSSSSSSRLDSKPAPPGKKKKSKTFTGCWTCRARRVKCDEARPSCNRCTRSRITCEGYGVRLAWRHGSQDDDAGPSSLFRKLIDLDPGIAQRSCAEVDDMLQQCSAATAGHDTQSFGPFSVFSTAPIETLPLASDRSDSPPIDVSSKSESCRMGEKGCSTWLVHQACLQRMSSASSASAFSMPFGVPSRTSRPLHPLYDSEKVDQFKTKQDSVECSIAAPQTDSTPGPDMILCGTYEHEHALSIDARSDNDDLPQDFPQWSSFDDTMEDSSMTREKYSPTPSYLTHSTKAGSQSSSDILRQPSIHRIAEPSTSRRELELIHHWLIFICKNLVLFDTVDNPYRVLFLGLASQALNNSSDCPKSTIAVFHGLCAASAESLNNLRLVESHDSNLSPVLHANAALQNLQQSVANRSQEAVTNVLAAMAMCIMRDTMSGQPRNWRVHAAGALEILTGPLMAGVQPDSDIHLMAEQYLCLAAFGKIQTKFGLQGLVDQLPDTEHRISKLHSIAKTHIRLIVSINDMARQETEPDPKTLDELELRIYLQAAPVSGPRSPHEPRTRIVLQHYDHVYYFAVLIYFQRVLRHKPSNQLQDLVQEGLQHLEMAEDLGLDSNGCVILWPCLVIASECEQKSLQDRALSFFRRKARHGFKSVDTAEMICQQYWVWREEHPLECQRISWQDFVAGTDLDIVPL